MEALIPLLVAVPLGGGLIMPILGRLTGDRRVAGLLPLLIMAFLVVLSLYAIGQPQTVYWAGGWKFPIGISMVADGFSKLLLVIIGAILSIAT